MTTGTNTGPLSQALQNKMTGVTPLSPEEAAQQPSGDAALASALGEETYEPPEIAAPDGFVALPLGLKNHEKFGTVNTAEVRELTGHDEERISRVLGTDNPWRVGTVMLECGVDRLGDEKATREMLQALTVGDRDYLLLQVRIMTYGHEVTYDLRCPFCDREQSVDLDLRTDIPLKEDADTNPLRVELERSKTVATVWLPTGKDDEMILRESAKGDLTSAETDTLLLADCVSALADGVWLGKETALSLPVADRSKILTAMQENQPGPDLSSMMVDCMSCEGEYRLPIRLPELFR